MSGLDTLHGQIKNPRSRIYRRIYFKRRALGTGLYEDNWQEVTDDVIKWGSIKKEIDATRVNTYKLYGFTVTMDNSSGRYNPYSDENSMWYGYSDEQRTLVKVECGFLYQVKGTNGIWTTTELPSNNIVFSGFISGDINVKGNNQISIPVVPLAECFRQFSARRLTGWNNSLTASDFITMVRDQQDSGGNYIFRPFFGDTTTNWEISATSVEYGNLNTSTAADVLDKTVWDVIQKLSEAENHIPLVTSAGVFKFRPREISTTTVFEFVGVGGFSSQYGQTIKKVNWYGKRYTKYYSRVSVKWAEPDTSTSYEVEESNYLVSGSSAPWTLGEKTLAIENTWIPTSTVAEVIALDLFTEVSAIKNEIEFTSSLVPHLDIFDRVLVTYDPVQPTENGLWDLYNWADSATGASTDDDLIWDSSPGDALKMYQKEFKLISIEMNLDSAECKFIGRE